MNQTICDKYKIYGYQQPIDKTIIIIVLVFTIYISESNLLSLVFGCQTATQQFSCSKCLKRYKYKGDLVRHQRYECGVEPQFQCHLCPYKAKQKGTLKTHVVLKHIKKLEV